jgi:hypothetical protein
MTERANHALQIVERARIMVVDFAMAANQALCLKQIKHVEVVQRQIVIHVLMMCVLPAKRDLD